MIEVEEMNLGDLFDQPVLPENTKQIVPKPPTYEESLKDVLEVKKRFMLILNICLKNHKKCLQNTTMMKYLIMR